MGSNMFCRIFQNCEQIFHLNFLYGQGGHPTLFWKKKRAVFRQNLALWPPRSIVAVGVKHAHDSDHAECSNCCHLVETRKPSCRWQTRGTLEIQATGHSRASKVTPFDSLRMISYYRPPIVTLCLECTVFEILRHIGRKSPKNLIWRPLPSEPPRIST